MDIPLTESEIEFIEHHHTPTSMTENLIPVNENAPQTWRADCDCIVENSLILMSDYTKKKIQDIQIGDEILTYEEKKRYYRKSRVLHKINKGIQSVVKIETEKGNSLETTLDHRILSRAENHSQWLWLKAENLLNHNVTTMPNTINNMQDYLLGQLFGVIDSDGSVVKRNNEVKHLRIYQKTELNAVVWLLNRLNIQYKQHEDRKDFYCFTLKVENASEYYKNLCDKFYSTNDYQLGYLCGFILGDGHYLAKNSTWGITQKKANQNERIRYLLNKFKLNSTGWKFNDIYKYYIPKCVLPMYNPESVKINKFFEVSRNRNMIFTDRFSDKVTKLELVGKKQVWDLTTEDGTFIANNILVHNCIYLYPYQHMMQNFSYLVANDSRLSPQEIMDKKKGAGDLYSIGSRNTGKCEYIENECQLANGSLKKFGDLIGTTQKVISFNEKALKLENDKACFKDNGVKPCYKIRLYSGKEIIVTENHPLYTNEGWIQSKNINKDMMIATPRSIDIKSDIIVDDNEAKIIGYLLGDGSCTTNSISIANINQELINEIYELGEYFDCKMRTDDDSHFFSKKTIPAIQRGANVRNNVHNIVTKYNINKLSKEKTIHPDVFMWPDKSVAIMLNRLFACDGHIAKRDNFFEITLASEKMIQQIQTLLLRFGIHSNYNYKKAKCEEKYFDAWRLYVDSDVNRLLNIIGIKSKDKVTLNHKKFETSDILPKNLISQYRHELVRPSTLNYKRKRGFSRNKVASLCDGWKNPNLFKLSNSDIYWEWIEKIDFVGDLPTVMVSVENNHTYISNNIVSHNSFFLKIDIFLTWIHKVREACIASFDQKHLSKVTDPSASYLDSHPFAQIFHLAKGNKKSVSRAFGGLKAVSQHGCLIESANEKIDGNKPGEDFHGKHYEIMWYEEASYMSKKGTEKRIDSGSSLGYIERPSGIPDLRAGSPLTKILQDKKLKRWVWKLPQYVRPDWSTKMKQKRIGEYNGESCFDTETEVLTNNGWKNHLTISEDDMVLSLNPETQYADYYKIKEIYKYDYDGKLNYYDGLKLNFAITDQHKLLYQTTKKGLRLETLNNLTNHNNKQEQSVVLEIQEFCRKCGKKLDLKIKRQKHFCSQECNHSFYKKSFDSNLQKIYIPNTFKYKGKDTKYIEFNTEKKNAKNHKIKMEDWLQFLGWWLAEGSIANSKRYTKNGEIYYSNTVNISQTKKYNLKEISDVLIRMGFTGKYNNSSLAFHFNSKAIVEHLKKECYKGDLIRVKTVYNCYNKKIPNYVYDLSPRLLNIFLNAFNKGDGDSKRIAYYTTSIQLADGLQELIFKVGHSAIIKRSKSGTKFGIKYTLCERSYKQKGNRCYFNKIVKKQYNGLIWDLEVEPHHNFFIRRNNRCHFTGNSSAYRLNVEAEEIEGTEGFWDMIRLKDASYNQSRHLKYFEVNKENFDKFKTEIIVERMAGTEQVFICSDIGYSGSPSQLIVIFKIGNKYKYAYNIPMFKLLHKEQAQVVKWLYDVLGGAFVATDATGDNGAIIDDLFDMGIPQEHLLKVFFNKNMVVGYQKDKDGKILKDNEGKPLLQEANTIQWAMSELEKLLYGDEDYGMDIPQDENFLEEFNGFLRLMNGTRVSYDSSTSDHKHQSFQCFAICRFFNEFNALKDSSSQDRDYGSF